MKTGYDQFFKKAQQAKLKTPPKKSPKKRKKNFPYMALVIGVIAVIGLSFVGADLRKFEEVLSQVEVSIFGTVSASEDTKAKPAEAKAEKAEKSAEAATAENKHSEVASSFTEEELSLFNNLDERRKQLDRREAELKKLEEELQKQREDLDKRLAQIEDVRKSIATQLEDKVKVDQERVDQLVSFYSSMKPQQAAKVIESLNEDLAVEVLTKMKKKNAAEVMNLINADKAQRLSEKFAGYRRK